MLPADADETDLKQSWNWCAQGGLRVAKPMTHRRRPDVPTSSHSDVHRPTECHKLEEQECPVCLCRRRSGTICSTSCGMDAVEVQKRLLARGREEGISPEFDLRTGTHPGGRLGWLQPRPQEPYRWCLHPGA